MNRNVPSLNYTRDIVEMTIRHVRERNEFDHITQTNTIYEYREIKLFFLSFNLIESKNFQDSTTSMKMSRFMMFIDGEKEKN
jgi:hypothetical protein